MWGPAARTLQDTSARQTQQQTALGLSWRSCGQQELLREGLRKQRCARRKRLAVSAAHAAQLLLPCQAVDVRQGRSDSSPRLANTTTAAARHVTSGARRNNKKH